LHDPTVIKNLATTDKDNWLALTTDVKPYREWIFRNFFSAEKHLPRNLKGDFWGNFAENQFSANTNVRKLTQRAKRVYCRQ
jgi:hypothetical protein